MKKTFIFTFIALALLLSVEVAIAQASIEDLNSALGFDNTVDDVESPIHFLVWLGMIVGAYLGFKKFK